MCSQANWTHVISSCDMAADVSEHFLTLVLNLTYLLNENILLYSEDKISLVQYNCYCINAFRSLRLLGVLFNILIHSFS